ncbi:MAG TPA: redox-sensing transcriptional repressor Rex, partial [bacterium]|nr:redox-sensing transcriptional repressor Rex [bacterium]
MARINKYKFPKTTIERLSYYFRALDELSKRGIDTISSEALGVKLNVKSSQIRKDLSYFGDFGKRGMGYDVKYLTKELRYILGLDREWPVIVMGAGHFGIAIAQYTMFKKHGFNIIALFDVSEERVGKDVDGIKILHLNELEKFIGENNVEIAIIAVPPNAAQDVTNLLVDAGIKAILNFAPVSLKVEKDVRVLSVDLTTK